MELSDSSVNSIGVILNTWVGMHKTRRKHGLTIAECYVLLSFAYLEGKGISVSEGSVRGITKAYHSSYLSKLFVSLLDKRYIVFARRSVSGRYTYYSLTDKGRNLAGLLLEGIQARQVAFFNKYLK